jgi:NAD(P)-dependent dehydrogenase (short-subunit alcohol dehydrogenase family)
MSSGIESSNKTGISRDGSNANRPKPLQAFDLSGRTALITGGSSGLGEAIALALAFAGASVILVARRETQLKNSCENLTAQGLTARYCVGDLSTQEGIEQTIAQLPGFGPIDILVNAAGVNLREPFGQVSPASWQTQLHVHLTAPMFLTQALAPAMAHQKWGRIINIASLQSYRAFDNSSPYGAAKGGVVQLTRAIAQAWGKDGITCNAIGPGFFPTALTAAVFNNPELVIKNAQQTCLGRNGELRDIDGLSVFLASDASAFITGQTIMLDGGFTAK